jgi:predicted esterase/HPt (histidine-containing phosphotransfer) domain-containing protein
MSAHVLCCAAWLLSATVWAADIVAAPPDPASFTPGKTTVLRLPAFSGLPGYPDKEPLYYELHVPPNYDPTRAYPLCVRFQPQGGKPYAKEMIAYFGPQIFSLAVSRFTDEAKDNLLSLHYTTIYRAAIHWVISHWNIDRSRIIFGGFSAGGWDASSVGMIAGIDSLSTHFLILGAGIRGSYRLPEQAGKPALVATGSEDMNVEWGAKAAEALKAAKLVVTYFKEPGVGHAVGPQMKQQAATWFAAFDPAAQAAAWLAEGEQAYAEAKTRPLGLARLLAVAQLGAQFPESAQALAVLDRGADLSEALTHLAQARAALATEDFHAVRQAAGSLAKSAAKAKSARLQQEADRLLRDSREWQYIAHQVAVKTAWDNGCGHEAGLLAQAGVKAYRKQLPDWGDAADRFPDLIAWMKALAPQRASKSEIQAQTVYADVRLRLWADQIASASTYQKAHKQVSAVVEALPVSPLRTRGEDVLQLLTQHGRFLRLVPE